MPTMPNRIIILLVFLFSNFYHTTITLDRVKGTIEVDERTKKYRLYIPSTYAADQPMPLVFKPTRLDFRYRTTRTIHPNE